MPKRSAGLLLYRMTDRGPEVLLVHPGGPFWARKDDGAWSIPKGEYADGEDPLDAARREFGEELGITAPDGKALPLGEVRQSAGKVVVAWAVEGDLDPSSIRSNTFTIELPKGSGRTVELPEVDRAEWFTIDAASVKLLAAQVALVERLGVALTESG